MSMIGGVSSAAPVATSRAVSSNNVQLVAAISMQKKSQDLVAEQTQELIASATGVGTKIDARG
jgi:hypothetical protein